MRAHWLVVALGVLTLTVMIAGAALVYTIHHARHDRGRLVDFVCFTALEHAKDGDGAAQIGEQLLLYVDQHFDRDCRSLSAEGG